MGSRYRPGFAAAVVAAALFILPGSAASSLAAAPLGGSAVSSGRDVGQILIGRLNGARPSALLLQRVRAGQLGGVIIFSDNVRSRDRLRRLIGELQRTARAGGNPPLLVAVDQEGGLVRRLPWSAPSMSAAQMGAAARPTVIARGQAHRAARTLASDGINLDLAPVADVPTVRRSFLLSRAFGRSPGRVAAAACAFANGLSAGGRVGATLKHFPGLGAAPANTDFDAVTITSSLARLRAGYLPYSRCAGRPRHLVMVASAAYRSLTGATPAVLSPVVYRRELPRFGFEGVTISDDLEADALKGRRDVSVRAARAGLDLQLYARTEGGSATAYRRITSALQSRRLSPARIHQAAQRVAVLKAQLGLADQR